MADYNPYAAPVDRVMRRGVTKGEYVPLSGRMAFAAISVVALVVFDVLIDVVEIAFGEGLRPRTHGAGHFQVPLILYGLLGMGGLCARLCSWVTVSVWTYRASANLRGLGRMGMAHTPGWSVAWYFVPLANLIKPVYVMREIWCASDPGADERSWVSSPSTALLGLWWTTLLISGFLSWVALGMHDVQDKGAFGLFGNALQATSAFSLVALMRGVGRRQERAAQAAW
jgi:hypothetical protein